MEKVTREVVIYHSEQPSDVSKALTGAILHILECEGVHPDGVLPVLAEGIIRTLVPIAETLGIEPVVYVHNFGEGIATCELELKEKKNDYGTK